MTINRGNVVLYARGETGQELISDIETVLGYCQAALVFEWVDDAMVEAIRSDVVESVTGHDTPITIEGPDNVDPNLLLYIDQRGTDGLTTMLREIQTTRDVGDVVVSKASRLIDTERTVFLYRALANEGVHTHIAAQGFAITGDDLSDPVKRLIVRLTGGIGDAVEDADRWRGRPPLGFTSERGTLKPAENYGRVCELLQSVVDGRTSKNHVAAELSVAWGTVDRALDHPERYGLDLLSRRE